MRFYNNIARVVYWVYLALLCDCRPSLAAKSAAPPPAEVTDDDRIALDAAASDAEAEGMQLARSAVQKRSSGQETESFAAAREAVFNLGIAYALSQDKQERVLPEIVRMYCLLGQDADLVALYIPRVLTTRSVSPTQARLIIDTVQHSTSICSDAQLHLLQEVEDRPEQWKERASAHIRDAYVARTIKLSETAERSDKSKLESIERSVAIYVFTGDTNALQTIRLYYGKLPPEQFIAPALGFHIRVAQEPKPSEFTPHEHADFVQRLEYLRAVYRDAFVRRPPQIEVHLGGLAIRRDFAEQGPCYVRQMSRYVAGPPSCFGDPSIATLGGHFALWGYPLTRAREGWLRGLSIGATVDYWNFLSRSVDFVRGSSTNEATGHGLRLRFDLRWKFRLLRKLRIPLPLFAVGYEWLSTFYAQLSPAADNAGGRLGSCYHSISIGGGLEIPFLSRQRYRLFADFDVRYKRSFVTGDLVDAVIGYAGIDGGNGVHVFVAPLVAAARIRRFILSGGVKTFLDFYYLRFLAGAVTNADPWPPQFITATRSSRYVAQAAWDRYFAGLLYFGIGY